MKKFFSLIAAVLFAGSMMASEAIMQYTGGVTTNMVGDGANNAATVGLDADLFTVLAEKGANQNLPGLNKANDIRLYADKNSGNGNTITVSIASGTITSIVLDIKQTATFVVKAGETAVTEEEGAYAINATSFSIQNTTTGVTTQLQLNKITITYESGDVTPTPTVNYYVAGSMNGWAADEAYMLTPNNQSLYEGEFTFAANDEFKVIGFDGTNTSWFPEGMGNNFQITEAGDYKITFNPAGNVEGWYEGFFNVVKKEEPVVPGEEINVTISSLTNPGQVLYADVIASSGYWDIYAFNDQYQIEISNISTTEAAGTYTIDDLDADFTYIVPAEGDTVHFTAGQVVLSITDGVVNVAGKLTGDDNNIYNINLTYKDPVAEQTVNVNITEGVLYDGYAAYGLYAVYGSAEDGTYVQLAIWTEAGFEGQFTEEDLDNKYVGSGLKDAAGNTQQIYAAAITVTPGAIEGAYTITADLLCYNNTLYKVTMKIGEEQGIDNVDAAVKAIKRLVNGQLVIEKAGKTYNMNGAVIR